MAVLASVVASAGQPQPAGARAEPVDYIDLRGWTADDHRAAFLTFMATCRRPPPLREGVPVAPALQAACDAALALAASGPVDAVQSRVFFESRFQPVRIVPDTGTGFLTGYFEPEFDGALAASPDFPTPVYGRPPDLVTRMPGDIWPDIDPALSSARRTAAGLQPYADRGAIDDGALVGQGLEIVWLRDPVDRFVMQVQGSGRVRLADGRSVRLAYAGRNGFPYTSLGRTLSEEEGIPPATMTMDRLVARLKADSGRGRGQTGQTLIRRNRSFVFFRIADELAEAEGPIGGAGVPLTPHRSIAADCTVWSYGLPVWLAGEVPASAAAMQPLARLAVVQDTGSAIVGPARFDLYFGSGAAAGDLAGRVRHPVSATVLWPRPLP